MNLQVGTSGFSYKEWKGSFYPEDLPAKQMLSYYAARLSAVEINNTFYRVPQPSVLEAWKEEVPADFKFCVKISQRVTHFKRLNDVAVETKYFLDVASVLGNQLGVILVQLPPNMKKDTARLEAFLELLPKDIRATFEFRHPSWLEDDVLEMLSKRNQALCVSDTDEMPMTHIDSTADWGYLRLRRVQYSATALKEWLQRIASQKWSHSFVFFKHEDEATGPKLAAQFLKLAKKITAFE